MIIQIIILNLLLQILTGCGANVDVCKKKTEKCIIHYEISIANDKRFLRTNQNSLHIREIELYNGDTKISNDIISIRSNHQYPGSNSGKWQWYMPIKNVIDGDLNTMCHGPDSPFANDYAITISCYVPKITKIKIYNRRNDDGSPVSNRIVNKILTVKKNGVNQNIQQNSNPNSFTEYPLLESDNLYSKEGNTDFTEEFIITDPSL